VPLLRQHHDPQRELLPLLELWQHLRLLVGGLPFMATQHQPVLARVGAGSSRDSLWEHARNSLGIARLLVFEGRPDALAATACRSAVENACRTALDHSGLPFDGDLGRAFEYLSAPGELLAAVETQRGAERLAATERAVGWIAGYLRAEVPERSWGF
jgi:hypothetical protein